MAQTLGNRYRNSPGTEQKGKNSSHSICMRNLDARFKYLIKCQSQAQTQIQIYRGPRLSDLLLAPHYIYYTILLDIGSIRQHANSPGIEAGIYIIMQAEWLANYYGIYKLPDMIAWDGHAESLFYSLLEENEMGIANGNDKHGDSHFERTNMNA